MVANTTFGFLAASLASAILGMSFSMAGHPIVGLGAATIPYAAFFIYFFGTWHNVPKNPDISVTGEAHYVAALAQRFMAAKDRPIIGSDNPVVGVPAQSGFDSPRGGIDEK